MEPRKRTHLANELMQEAHLMMGVLEKALRLLSPIPRKCKMSVGGVTSRDEKPRWHRAALSG
jgi:type II secretory pathway component PulJ